VKPSSAVVATSPTPRAILTPWIDALCIGGVAIFVVGWMLLFRVPFNQGTWASFWFLQVAINYPHFIASYRLLYGSKEMIKRYKWASLYLPALLLAYIAFAFVHVTVRKHDLNMNYYWIVDYVASMYLAVHYTGQAWGMTASFGFLGGISLTKLERKILRSIFYVFLAWHVVTYHHNIPLYQIFVPGLRRLVPWAFLVISLAAEGAMVVGIVTFFAIWRRNGRRIPIRMVLPMVSLYLGYVLYTRSHAALFVLQLAHSLQYLLFPLRVEMNRSSEKAAKGSGKWHIVLYLGTLVGAGWLVFMGSAKIPGDAAAFTSLILIGAINIHHYFIDGCVWKISTPEVRRDLFRHLPPVAGSVPPAKAASPEREGLPRMGQRGQ
jgi:hypothetical protein